MLARNQLKDSNELLSANELNRRKSSVFIKFKNKNSIAFYRIKTILWKYYLETKRVSLPIAFYFLLPLFTLLILKLCWGVPKHLPIAVFNDDQGTIADNYLNSMDEHYVKLNYYKTIGPGIESVKCGLNYALLVFNQNYSTAFESRISGLLEASDDDIRDSLLGLYLDNSDINSIYVIQNILSSFIKMTDKLEATYNIKLSNYINPLSIKETVYGDYNLEITQTMYGFIMLLMTFVTSSIFSTIYFILERFNNSIERFVSFLLNTIIKLLFKKIY